jgi:hypothetical protein
MGTATFVDAHTPESNDINAPGATVEASELLVVIRHQRIPAVRRVPAGSRASPSGQRRLLSNLNNLDDCHVWTVW